jgi:hypothetical protein
MSGSKLRVAMMSSQKKKEYLNPSWTQELIMISIRNINRAKVRKL